MLPMLVHTTLSIQVSVTNIDPLIYRTFTQHCRGAKVSSTLKATVGSCLVQLCAGLTWMWFVLLVIFICGAALATTLYLQRRQRQTMDEHVRRLLNDYVPLESSSSDRTYACGSDIECRSGSTKREARGHSVFVRVRLAVHDDVL